MAVFAGFARIPSSCVGKQHLKAKEGGGAEQGAVDQLVPAHFARRKYFMARQVPSQAMVHVVIEQHFQCRPACQLNHGLQGLAR